ncbi:MAG TPA: hypothetical protein VLE72_01925 [Candidatus Saccharimonadales bacterium]|nr:hypothetical protein [Candidatus Saccharimonadales bacterium]
MCEHQLVKSKAGYLCLNCGYAGPGKRSAKSPTVARVASPPEQTKTASPAPQLSSQPVAETPPSPPAPPKNPRPVKTITVVAVIVLVLGILLAAYILPARAAGRNFQTKVAAANSFNLAGNLSLHGSAFLEVVNSNLDFNGVYAKKGTSDQLNFDGQFGNRNYQGTMVAKGGNLYTKLSGNDLPFIRYNQGAYTYRLQSNQYYQTKLDTSLYKYYCETRPDSKYPSALVWYQAIRQIQLHYSPLILYGQKADGHTTTHLRGSVDSHSLAAAWENINSSLPQGCDIDLLVSNLNQLNVTYDLWTSTSYDKLILHLNSKDLGLSGTLTLKFDQYNAATEPSLPTGASNLGDIFAARAGIQTRDYQRRSDVDAISAALKKYFLANKTLPSSLAKLAPKYLTSVPKDPNGSDYHYTVVRKTYTVSTTLEDTGATYAASGP